MDDLRLGIPTDFPLVMDRVVASFRERNPVHPRFEDLYPDSVSAESRRSLVNVELPFSLKQFGLKSCDVVQVGTVLAYGF